MSKTVNMLKKLFAVLVAVCCITSVFTVSGADAENPEFYCKGLNGSAGENITLTIGVKSSYTNVGGLNISFTYDSKQLAYVNGSRKLLCETMKNGDLNTDQSTSGKVAFLWSSGTGATVSGDIFSVQFRVISGLSSLKIYVNEFFKNDADFTDIINKIIVIDGSNAPVDNTKIADVMKKISEIGTVENTAECKARIDAARGAYQALSYNERALISNYATLVNAEETYAALNSGEVDVNAAIAAFCQKHSGILSKTKATVQATDKAAIENAISDWNALPTNVKIHLAKEKNLLNSLLKVGGDKEEAEKFLQEYLGQYGKLLEIDDSLIDYSYYDACFEAINALDSYADMNDYFNEVAADAIAKTKKKYNIALESKKKQDELSSPDVKAAEDFRDTYARLLGMSLDNVSADDLADAKVAAYAYSLLSDGAKSLLPNVESKLSKIISIAETMSVGETVTVEVEKEVIREVIKTVNNGTASNGAAASVDNTVKAAAAANRNVMLRAKIPAVKQIVWWLLGSCGCLTVISAVLVFVYLKSKRKGVNAE